MQMQDNSVREFSLRMADPNAFPAGGSASAATAAFAAALCAMCAGVAVRRGHTGLQTIVDEAQVLRLKLLDLIQRDAEGYEAYLAARRNKDDPGKQEAALMLATKPPLDISRLSLRLLDLLHQLRPHCPRAAVADAQTARLLSLAAAKAGLVTARVNLKRMKDRDAAGQWMQEVASLEQKLRQARNESPGSA